MIRFVLFALLFAPALFAEEPTAEDLVAANLEARGGAEAWSKVESMVWEGQFTAFSLTEPFVLEKRRPNLLRMKYRFNGQPAMHGFDGQDAWWVQPLMVDWAIAQPPAEATVTIADADFDSALFDWQAKGHSIEYQGPGEVDGMEALLLKVARADGAEETWYLDPESKLEIARDGPGSDFGNPMPQRTWYDEWREVDGVLMPFYVEREWGTRHRVWDIQTIRVNEPVDPAIFAMPPAPGSEPLEPLAGEWQVAVEYRSSPQAPFQQTTTTSEIEARVGGTLLYEAVAFVDDSGARQERVRTYSYDRFREAFRITSFDEFTQYQKIFAGTFDEEQRLVATTKSTEMGWQGFGQTMYDRVVISQITADGFVLEEDLSFDGGENYATVVRMTYTRPGGEPEGE